MIENTEFAVGISPLSVIVTLLPVLAALSLFPVLSECCTHLLTPFSSSVCRKRQIYRWNFNAISDIFRDISISGFGGYLRLSIILGIP